MARAGGWWRRVPSGKVVVVVVGIDVETLLPEVDGGVGIMGEEDDEVVETPFVSGGGSLPFGRFV